MKKSFDKICIVALFILLFTISISAHQGKTDSNGGHYNHSTGEYHYHHGYSAHDHYDMDGDGKKDCPYDFDDKTNYGNSTGSSTSGNSSNRTDSNKSSNQKQAKVKTSDIITAILEIIGISILLLVYVGYPLYTIIMTPMKFLLTKIIKRDVKKSTLSVFGVMAVIITIAIVVTVVSVIVLLIEGIL